MSLYPTSNSLYTTLHEILLPKSQYKIQKIHYLFSSKIKSQLPQTCETHLLFVQHLKDCVSADQQQYGNHGQHFKDNNVFNVHKTNTISCLSRHDMVSLDNILVAIYTTVFGTNYMSAN